MLGAPINTDVVKHSQAVAKEKTDALLQRAKELQNVVRSKVKEKTDPPLLGGSRIVLAPPKKRMSKTPKQEEKETDSLLARAEQLSKELGLNITLPKVSARSHLVNHSTSS